MKWLQQILFLLLIYFAYRTIKNLLYPPFKKGYTEGRGKSNPAILDEMVKDPSCQVFLPKKEAIAEKLGNEWYYFCSEECLRKYREKTKEQ